MTDQIEFEILVVRDSFLLHIHYGDDIVDYNDSFLYEIAEFQENLCRLWPYAFVPIASQQRFTYGI